MHVFTRNDTAVVQQQLLCFICILVLFANAASEAPLQLKGMVLDTLFKHDSLLTAELLETGDTLRVTFGAPFSFELTDDQSWNLCIRSDTIEQCYVITRTDTSDSLVTDTLLNDNRLEVFSTFIAKKPKTAAPADTVTDDTLQRDSAPEETVSEIVTQLRPVVIQVRKRPKRRIGQSTVSSKAIQRQPGLAEADVIKAIQALPGVVASSDFSSKIYVRGGGSDQNLFLFDNGVVYSPVHFFGLFSTFLVDGVESVDFYKGGFSPEYGNRLSSVVDITSRQGGKENNDTLTIGGSAQITTFASTVSLEASKGRLRLNVSGRATYIKEALAFLRNIGATDVDIDYRFYDFQGNIAYQISDDQYVTLSGYTGEDNLVFSPLLVSWGNTVIPVNYYWDVSDELSFSASLSYSWFEQDFGIENLQSMSNYIRSISFKPLIEYRGFKNHLITTGLESQYFEILFGSEMDFINFSLEEVKYFLLHSLILEDNYTLGKLDLSIGIRGNYFSELSSFSAEPRLSLSWSFSSEQRIEAHVGYYRQFINSLIFGDMESLNETYYAAGKEPSRTNYPSSSLLFSLGYTLENIFSEYDFIWEGYYKTLDDLFIFDPDSKPDSIRNDPYAKIGDLFITGEGYSLGTEVSLRKTGGLFSGGLSYAFGFSVQKENNRVYRAKWEIPHSFKLDGGITWRDPEEKCLWKSKKRYLRSSLQIKYTSGLPYSEITGHLPAHYLKQGGDVSRGPQPGLPFNTATPLSGRNMSRYPSYGRIDFKVIDWGRDRAWNFSWTLLNILNRENVFIYIYDKSEQPPERITIPQFPFFPILFSYKRYF